MKRKILKKHFTMLEIVCALALFATLSTAFFASLRTLGKMDEDFTSENRALMVLDNTFERIGAIRSYNVSDVETAFLDEYAKSGLSPVRIKAVSVKHGNSVMLSLIKKNGNPLIEVDIKCAAK